MLADGRRAAGGCTEQTARGSGERQGSGQGEPLVSPRMLSDTARAHVQAHRHVCAHAMEQKSLAINQKDFL